MRVKLQVAIEVFEVARPPVGAAFNRSEAAQASANTALGLTGCSVGCSNWFDHLARCGLKELSFAGGEF